MRLEKLVYSEYLHGKQFPVGTVILRLDNKTELAISDFHFQNGKKLFYGTNTLKLCMIIIAKANAKNHIVILKNL